MDVVVQVSSVVDQTWHGSISSICMSSILMGWWTGSQCKMQVEHRC